MSKIDDTVDGRLRAMVTQRPFALTQPEAKAPRRRPLRKRTTPAMFRILWKASEHGQVRRAGGTSGTSGKAIHPGNDFDAALIVDRCVAAGLLAPGIPHNTYVLTGRGKAKITRARR